MGMYTNLKFRARIKSEYLHIVEKLATGSQWDFEWIEFGQEFEDWCNVARCNFIPHGFCCVHGYENKNYLDGNVWVVSCSLKNYNNEINEFLSTVLSLISESAEGVIHYEEAEKPDTFKLVDGVLTIDYAINEWVQ